MLRPLMVIPPPDTANVAPARLVPVKVTGTAVPFPPEVGAIDVSVGAVAAGTTANVTLLLVPPGVVTLTFLVVYAAAAVIVKVAVTEVAVGVPVMVAVTPPPLTATEVAPVRLVPVSVTATLGAPPEVGVIDVSVGSVVEAVTVNVTLLVVPPGAVTLTVLPDNVAVAVIVNVAVTVVSLTTVRPLTATPVPDTDTAVAPVRPVPVRVTGTAVPRAPVLGEIEVSVGAATLLWNSTAPTSTALFDFLKVPKKSTAGAAA